MSFFAKQLFEKELGDSKTNEVLQNIEVPLVPVLADMELEGINLDIEALKVLNLPITRQNYLELSYPDGIPESSAEFEESLPEEIRSR